MLEEAELHRHGDRSRHHFSSQGWKKFFLKPMSRLSVMSSDRTDVASSSLVVTWVPAGTRAPAGRPRPP
jgi:hypothetical protein